MQVFHGLNHLPTLGRVAATVGSYDGVHVGHRTLLAHLKREAERIGGQSLVITFSPHPRLALDPMCEMRLLTSTEEKSRLIEEEGIDYLLVIPFDRPFSRTEPAEFIRLLVEQLGVESLVVGYDHRFGHNKSGGKELLAELQQAGRLSITEVPEQEVNQEHLSSTAIRRLIEKGEMLHAARLLGTGYRLDGDLNEEGIFTPCEPHKLLPPAGSYRVFAEGYPTEMPLHLTIDSKATITLQGIPAPKQGAWRLRFEEE